MAADYEHDREYYNDSIGNVDFSQLKDIILGHVSEVSRSKYPQAIPVIQAVDATFPAGSGSRRVRHSHNNNNNLGART